MPPRRSTSIAVPFVRLPHANGLPLPAYQTGGAAGLDLVAALPAGVASSIAPGARALIPTGLVLEIPMGFEAQVRPRSGLAFRHGVTVLNSPGTIDADYRGEVQVILVNLGSEPVIIERGERIAQLVFAPVVRAKLAVATRVKQTKRGAGGFGSTGKKSAKKSVKAQRRKPARAKASKGT